MKKLKKKQRVYIRAEVTGGDLDKRPRVVAVDDDGNEHEDGSMAMPRKFLVEKKPAKPQLTDVRIVASPGPQMPQLPRARECGVGGCTNRGHFLDYATQGSWCLEHALAHIGGLQAQAAAIQKGVAHGEAISKITGIRPEPTDLYREAEGPRGAA